MKKIVSMVSSILIAVLVVVWIIATIPFAKNIDQEIDAVVYKDGAVIGETAVYMNGKKTRYLFRADSFVGEFRVYYAEKTDVDDLQTKIQWQKDSSIQRISHFYKGNFTTSDERGIECNMMISDHQQFELVDGTLISEQLIVKNDAIMMYSPFLEHGKQEQ